MTEELLVTSEAGVCEVRFNRPGKRNAITFAMYEAFGQALAQAETDPAVRGLLVSGEGAGFCAGNDLNDFLTGPNFTMDHPVMGFLKRLATFGKPLLAAVHGQTVGIGVTMLLHCDLIIAARSTQFSMPFVSLGLVPEAASSLLLTRQLGPQRAAQLLLLGEGFGAAEAERLGLINRVVEDAALMQEARAVAQQLVRQPPYALSATRRLLRGDPAAVLERIEAEARIFSAQLKSAEFREAVGAFLARGRAK
jgi:enoyl-CoA hydratase/carnithine racemase